MKNHIYGDEGTPLVALNFFPIPEEDEVKFKIVTSGDQDGPLSELKDDEKADLKLYEEWIEEGIMAAFSLGKALWEIKSRKLYRAQYTSFEKYCVEKWSISVVHADRQIKAAKTSEVLARQPIGCVAPLKNEAQARQVTGLDEKTLVKVATEVKKEFGDDATAEDWNTVREKHAPRVSKSERKKASPDQAAKVVPLPKTWNAGKQVARLSEVLLELKDMIEEGVEHEDMHPFIEEAIELQNELHPEVPSVMAA